MRVELCCIFVVPLLAAGVLQDDTPLATCSQTGSLGVFWAGDRRILGMHWGEHGSSPPAEIDIPLSVPISPGTPLQGLTRASEYNGVVWAGDGGINCVYEDLLAWGEWKFFTTAVADMTSATRLGACGREGFLSVYWSLGGKLRQMHWGKHNDWSLEFADVLPSTLEELPILAGQEVHALCRPDQSDAVAWAGQGAVHLVFRDPQEQLVWKYAKFSAPGVSRTTPLAVAGRNGGISIFWAGDGKVNVLQHDATSGVAKVDYLAPDVPIYPGTAVYASSGQEGDKGVLWSGTGEVHHLFTDASAVERWQYEKHPAVSRQASQPRRDPFHEQVPAWGYSLASVVALLWLVDSRLQAANRWSKSGGDDGHTSANGASGQKPTLRVGRCLRLFCGLVVLVAVVAPLTFIVVVYEKNKLKLQNGDEVPSSLQGHGVLITGSSSGMGFDAARYFYIMGANVLMHGPDQSRTAKALERMQRVAGGWNGQASAVFGDLSDFGQVRRLAGDVKALILNRGLHTLVLNAAFMYSGEAGQRGAKTASRPGLTFHAKSGHDFVMAVNHLGHFLLAVELAPALAPGASVVVVTGSGSWHGDFKRLFHGPATRIKYEDTLEEAYKAYYDSKLANVCFSRGLRRWLKASAGPEAPRVVLFDPGRVHTAAALERNSSLYTTHSYETWRDFNVGVMKNGVGWVSQSPQDAGWHLVMAAFTKAQPEPDLISAYFFPQELFWWYADPSMSDWRTLHDPIAGDGTPHWGYPDLWANAYQILSWGTTQLFSSFGPECGNGEADTRHHWRWSAREVGLDPEILSW